MLFTFSIQKNAAATNVTTANELSKTIPKKNNGHQHHVKKRWTWLKSCLTGERLVFSGRCLFS
jgi:hypothetical protein